MTLNSEQEAFFRMVGDAAFANPFSAQRVDADRRIAGLAREDRGGEREELLEHTLDSIRSHIGQLRAGSDLPLLAGLDSEAHGLVGMACLFLVYHELTEALDRLILTQENTGKSVAVPFAREALARLSGLGFDEGESRRYLALFWQLRRAFHFIRREITGQCPAIVRLRMHLWNAVFTCQPAWYLHYLCGRMEDFSTLLLGETGTGKSAAAKALGRSAFIPFDAATGRFAESFMETFQAINLAQFPVGLMESELFGHRKGAFTGAVDNHQGILERCGRHGTVFIDEIGDVEVTTQTKLLTVLQERKFSPVGSHETLHFHGRVIAATNRDLASLRRQGQFRNDFYYRLCSDVIEVPSLRQRILEDPTELERVVNVLVTRMVGSEAAQFAGIIEQRLRECVPAEYPWPGNVRELEQAIRRICLTGSYQPQSLDACGPEGSRLPLPPAELSAQAVLRAHCRQLYDTQGSYAEVSRATGLDRRTVKKYVTGQP